MPSRLCHRRGHAVDESGFSLIEATAALGISVILFVVLAQSLSVSLRMAHQNRLQQIATAEGVEAVEFARSLTWDELVMTETTTGDVNVNGSNELIGARFELTADEPLVVDVASVDALVDPQVTATIDEQLYVVSQYVTEIQPGLRRFVVEVTWQFNDTVRRHHTSTVVSELRG